MKEYALFCPISCLQEIKQNALFCPGLRWLLVWKAHFAMIFPYVGDWNLAPSIFSVVTVPLMGNREGDAAPEVSSFKWSLKHHDLSSILTK